LKKEILEDSNALVHQSVCDRDVCKPNDDGWGYGFSRDSRFQVVKAATRPHQDRQFADIAATPFERVLVHIRRASVGEVSKENTHPWQLDNELVFAHNGSIYGFDKIRHEAVEQLPVTLRDRMVGTTDSEFAMYLFVSHLLKSDKLDSRNLTSFRAALHDTMDVLRQWSVKAGETKLPKLNFMFMTKYFLIATRVIHSLGFYPDRPSGSLITSEPLNDNDDWREMEEDTMIAVWAEKTKIQYEIMSI